jgi:LysR family transcriptional regulator, glycine cleavage system transcriptional activator
MAERLPPLNALKAFEAAARAASVTRAARELNVSPAAVSHQIRNLEAYLGVQLFERLNRAVRLTPAGEAALPLLRDGFGRLAEAVQQLRAHDGRRTLRISAPPSFAAKWLAPRLSRYAAVDPEVDIRLAADDALFASAEEAAAASGQGGDVDLAIRFGPPEAIGHASSDGRSDKLLDVSALPLCSPDLLETRPLRRPEDLRHHTLLHDDTDYPEHPSWRAWLEAAGVDASPRRGIDPARGPRFNQAAQALEAAIAGQGVVLTLLPLARADLAAGRLMAPFALALPLRSAYWLIGDAGPETADGFRRWLLAEAQAESEVDG